MGAHDQAITAAQRALALATAVGEVVLQRTGEPVPRHRLWGTGRLSSGDRCFGQTVASLDGPRRYERFGQVYLPAVHSRAYLAWCHAEMGMFAEGRTLGDEGLRIAEAVAHPGSLTWAY